MKRKEGISLIVLVITIVVIVILATAVILSIANNNPIGNASEAVEKNNRAEYESELSLYIAKQYADKNGDYDPSTLNKQANEVSKIITSLSEKDKEKYLILKGKLVENTKQNQVNVSYAAQNKDPDTQTEISVDKIQELCPSITEEEEAKEYIIWLGKLYKKEETSDGIRYVNSDGERAKFLDEETEVTETMIEFLKAFNEKQEELSEDESLLYNGGYITGINDHATIDEVKLKLESENFSNIVIKTYKDGEKLENDIANEDRIYLYDETKGEYIFLAYVIIYGDVYNTGIINDSCANPIKMLLLKPDYKTKMTTGQFISADVNHNGIIDEDDTMAIYYHLSGKKLIDQKKFATIPKLV